MTDHAQNFTKSTQLINWVDFGDLVNVHQECGKQPIGNGKEELDALNKNLFVLFAWSV